MSRGSMILKKVWMRISIRNYEYDSILLIFLNTHAELCYSHWSLPSVPSSSKIFCIFFNDFLSRFNFQALFVLLHGTIILHSYYFDHSTTNSSKIEANCLNVNDTLSFDKQKLFVCTTNNQGMAPTSSVFCVRIMKIRYENKQRGNSVSNRKNLRRKGIPHTNSKTKERILFLRPTVQSITNGCGRQERLDLRRNT